MMMHWTVSTRAVQIAVGMDEKCGTPEVLSQLERLKFCGAGIAEDLSPVLATYKVVVTSGGIVSSFASHDLT